MFDDANINLFSLSNKKKKRKGVYLIYFNKPIFFIKQNTVIFAQNKRFMGTDNEIFKLRIKDILSDKNMTSKELAEKMGKAPQYVSNIINGGKGASISTLIEVAKALDVEFRDLFAATNVSPNSEVNGYVKVKGNIYEVHSFEDLRKLLELDV